MSGIIKHQHKRFDDVHVRGASDSGILEHQHKGKRFDNLPLLSIGYIQPRPTRVSDRGACGTGVVKEGTSHVYPALGLPPQTRSEHCL